MRRPTAHVVPTLMLGVSFALTATQASRLGAPAAGRPPGVALDSLLKANAYEITLSGDSLSGPGFGLLMRATQGAQFVALGEPHNAREVPALTAALFTSLNRTNGFSYLALEQDPVMAHLVSAPAAVGKRASTIALARAYPNGFTFITDQELELIAGAGAASSAKTDRIWGLDQVFGAIHALNELSAFAPNPAVRERTLSLIGRLKTNEVEQFKKRERYTLAQVGTLDEFNQLLQEYHPRPGSDAEFLVSQMTRSARIYRNNVAAESGQLTGYSANVEREENMKALFMREYRQAQAAGERFPRVLLKLGQNHVIRGRSWTNVLTLGNFISELATSNDATSFHIAVYNNNASGDYGVLAATPDYRPLADAAPKDRWAVVDFRPLREYVHAGRVTGLNAELRQIILGFDAAILLGGASAGTYKLVGAE